MDWVAVVLSLKLAIATQLLLLPPAIIGARWLALTPFRGKVWIEGLLALPLVLPPTVIGYYLLVIMGSQSPLGRSFENWWGQSLAFSFTGLVIASAFINIPFAVQPAQRAFEAIPTELHEAAKCCGLTFWQSFHRIELPLAWPGILSAVMMTFAHTLGDFGVVLLLPGHIPGETRTLAISIYDRTQSFDFTAAGTMSLFLLLISVATIAVSYGLAERLLRRRRLT